MLTLEEFRRLTEADRRKRYMELSNHDKFLVRTGAAEGQYDPDNPVITEADFREIAQIFLGKEGQSPKE